MTKNVILMLENDKKVLLTVNVWNNLKRVGLIALTRNHYLWGYPSMRICFGLILCFWFDK